MNRTTTNFYQQGKLTMNKPNIYRQHDASFANVSAFVVVKDGERVATIAFKFPRDGAGRLYAYVHWIGDEMVRGIAGGYGYDKRSAACADAGKKLAVGDDALGVAFAAALRDGDGGSTWDRCLADAGFTVFQAV
jgi:hypothetical protein